MERHFKTLSPLFFLSPSVLPQHLAEGVEAGEPPDSHQGCSPFYFIFFLSKFMLWRVSLCPSHPRAVAIRLRIATHGEARPREGRASPRCHSELSSMPI